jgi:hypothetical protein
MSGYDGIHIPVPKYCMCNPCRAMRRARAERNGRIVAALLLGGVMLAIGWAVVDQIADVLGWP